MERLCHWVFHAPEVLIGVRCSHRG